MDRVEVVSTNDSRSLECKESIDAFTFPHCAHRSLTHAIDINWDPLGIRIIICYSVLMFHSEVMFHDVQISESSQNSIDL